MPIRPIRLIDERDEEEANKKKEAKREPIQVELKSIVLLFLFVSFFYNALTIYNTQMIKAQE